MTRIQRLADSGRSAEVVSRLAELPAEQLEGSPTLALILGIAQARLGHHGSGKQWIATALESARRRGDGTVAARSLNVSGAIAFQEGRTDEGARYFTQGLAEAERQGDRATVGRCSNNLGIIANLRGEHGQAVGHYTRALAAFQQVGSHTGIAEALHNLAITYRDQRAYTRAFESEERAGEHAGFAGDLALRGTIHCGRGEIRLRTGEIEVARVEIERALSLHRDVEDLPGELEALRALAGTIQHQRDRDDAEAILRDVIARARALDRPFLLAEAERDLARLLHRSRRDDEARRHARHARERFRGLGAVCEVHRLDLLLREMLN
ncbi:MAG: tetratricopeptide repeat protein [Gemmatimonadetes bacterium]|nr:tetratricopeptide repeat protein [Gemmatimonadota bacterium]